jgi:hypothetical protein
VVSDSGQAPDLFLHIRYPGLAAQMEPGPIRLASMCGGAQQLSAHTTGEAIVRVDSLSKRYGRVRALDDVAFSIRAKSIDAAMRW